MVRRRSQSFNFEIGHPDLSAALAKDIIEAVMPKESRKQAQQQLMLEAITRSYPALSQMPKEEREKLYSQVIFPGYGVYQPPTFRRLFGAKPETILPLPEGGIELEGATKVKSPFGRRSERPAGINLPQTGPFTFAPSPLLQPEHETELETQAKKLYPESPEDQQTWLKTQKTALMTKIKPTKEEMLWETIERAERMIDTYKQANPQATDEQAIAALPVNIRRRYQEHVEEAKSRGLQREALTEESKGRKAEREERMKLLTGREKRLSQQQDWYQSFQEKRLGLQDQWKKLAARGKTPQQVYRDALTAYSLYSRNISSAERSHNMMEMGFAKLDPNYLPTRFSEPKLSFDDWLKSEGMMFYERILDMEKGGGERKKGVEGEGAPGVTPLPQPRSEKETPVNNAKKKLGWK